jgi:hypothetical protein
MYYKDVKYMFCPNCGTENPPNAKFCYECGINLLDSIKIDEADKSEVSADDTNINIGSDDQSESNIAQNESEDTEDTEDESSGSKNNCIICKAGEMIPMVHKGSFGFGIKTTLECNNCGAVFEKKGQKYKLSKVTDTDQPLWIRYGHQTLTEDEWTRIGDGGVSDAEQQKINQEKIEQEKHQLIVQKENDANQFLTSLQNGKLTLTSNNTSPIILKKNESLSIVMHNITLQEPRAVRQTHAAYGGPTIRVAKGVSFRLGGASARSESHEEIRAIDRGSLILTTKRLIFIGSKRTINIDLRKIMAIEAYTDGIESQRENKQKTEYFKGTNSTIVNFNIDGRPSSIPLTGVVLRAAIQGAIANIE